MDPQLAALVVHDLKNELGGLEASLQALAHQHPEPLAQAAWAQCSGLRQRFIHFLTLYGGDGQLRAHASDESPTDLLQAAARDAALGSPGLSLTVRQAEASPPFWYFDPRLARMALDAALHNAGRFARQSIALQALEQDGYLVLRVDDDGPGPGAGPDQDRDASHATGLGTALCEAVARAHRHGERQGHARLSTRPGGGARFELWLA